jgi:hypothetical protein
MLFPLGSIGRRVLILRLVLTGLPPEGAKEMAEALGESVRTWLPWPQEAPSSRGRLLFPKDGETRTP